MGFDVSKFAEGAAAAGASGIIGTGLSLLKGAVQYGQQKSLMNKQHQLELENIAAQDKFQRQLALDASLLRKRSLQNAGYSTADPDGTGTVAPSVSAPSTSASGSFSMPSADFAPGISVTELSNARLMDSQAELNRIEARWKSKELEGKVGLLNAQIKEITDTLPKKLDLLDKQAADLVASKKMKEEQAKVFTESARKIIEEIRGITIDNNYKDDLNKWTIDKLKKECFVLAQQGKFEQAKAKLADVGIIVGADWMTQFASLIHAGTAPELIDEIKETIQDIFDKSGTTGSSIGSSLLEGLYSSGVFQDVDGSYTDSQMKKHRYMRSERYNN